MIATRSRTLFEKIWASHVVRPETRASPAAIYVDLHLLHELTSPRAFAELRARGLRVRRPDRTVATMDRATPTAPARADGRIPVLDARVAAHLLQFERNCADFGVPLHVLGSEEHGIVHVIGPEQGRTQPGMTVVCADSHTSTHGAFGALGFAIGVADVASVLATQCLLLRRPRTMEVRLDGRLPAGVTAKDIILAVIAETGLDGAAGYVIEYTGSAVRALDMEARMTLCNMAVETGARAGMIAPDDVTFEYLAGRRYAPRGADWDRAVAAWRRLPSDPGAAYDATVWLNVDELAPMITYGTNPGMAMPIDGRVPAPEDVADPCARAALENALDYMDLRPGESLLGKLVDAVFIGSCTNSRISDLRAAARMLRGHRVAPGVRMIVVPGSRPVKRQAEAEGLDRIFRDAGAEWREAGCSMCAGLNNDRLEPGQYAVSTTNRNFQGRQGQGVRTFLASPLTAVAAAVCGAIADPREPLR
ncbi:MAG TPA: 3-isopropylmalate dehydratase large subunit [Longimicrobiales bacterium]